MHSIYERITQSGTEAVEIYATRTYDRHVVNSACVRDFEGQGERKAERIVTRWHVYPSTREQMRIWDMFKSENKR